LEKILILRKTEDKMKIKIVSKNVLKQLLQRNKRKKNTIKKKFPNFQKWINNEDYPTYDQLLQLSQFFNIPFGYFFLEKLPRKKRKKKKENKKEKNSRKKTRKKI